MGNNYVTYHLHTENSLLDSCTNHKLYADYAASIGQKAIGYSEHGNTYNWIEKKMYANSKGLKYLHECEVYLTESLDVKVRDNYHTILIAKNYDGFCELNTLIDLSTQPDHFYYKPRITFDEFFSISDNIIKISACLASPLSKYPESENADRNIYEKLLNAYDYYEIQPHNVADQKQYNYMLFLASKKYNKPLIAGTDTHSLNKYKAECRSILQKAKKIQFADEDSYDLTYKTYDELVDAFKEQGAIPIDEVLEAIENTNRIADMVDDFELDTSFKYPKLYENEEEVFKKRINMMYNDKVRRGVIKKDDRYKEMVNEEFRVFKKIGMIGFMLFMSELVCWCWDNDIPVGFCRGSVGGSVIAFLTDIIDVNPVEWGTMFSRFANEDRKEIGDIDVDIPPSKRHLVYEHIISEYGEDKTAYVLAIGTIAAKGAIDDIARALSFKYKENAEYDLAEKYSLNNTKEIKSLFETDEDDARSKYPELFYYFDGLVGTAVSQSMHPAGIIVSPVTLPDNYGTFWNNGKRILSINMEEIHDVSLVKYDILGLKNVEIIDDCCKLANIKYPKSHEVNWLDDDVWDHISDSPVGIFQFESRFAFDSMKKMKCRCVNDLSLVNASIRPSGETYRDRLLARETNKNPSEIIDQLLAPNHGFLVFQEDVIAFLQKICGLSGSEADNVRRAIGRKQMDRLQVALPKILEGYCAKSDKPREIAEKEARTFLDIIESSSRYMFGFNHSTGYSMIGYMCGWLRHYYPTEFITAYLNNANNDDDINNGTDLARNMGITISSIKFRKSSAQYSCDRDSKTIFKGLASIKYLGESVASDLLELKDNNYDSFIDLLSDIKNTSLDDRQIKILISLDFFSEFGDINMLLKQYEMYDKIFGKKQFSKDKIQSLGIPEYVIKKYSKETAKQYREIDSTGLLNEMCAITEYPATTFLSKINYEIEYLGYAQSTLPNLAEEYYLIVDITGFSNNILHLYQLKTGKMITIKVKSSVKKNNPVRIQNIIKVLEISEEKKWKKVGGEWVRGDDNEQVLTKYSVLKENRDD